MKSHHRNQLPAYCHCGRCRGTVKQKPRTIDDHRTRYPRDLSLGLEPDAQREDSPERAGHPSLNNEVDHHHDPPYQSSPSPDSIILPNQPASQDWNDELENLPEPVDRLANPLEAHMAPGTPPDIPMLGDELDELDEIYGLGDNDAEADNEYPFDRLLDYPNNDHHDHRFFNDMDADYGNNPEGDHLNNELNHEDFGLPDGDDAPEIELPGFQFELDEGLDEELNQVPDDDPDDAGEDPGAVCEAFQEHELI